MNDNDLRVYQAVTLFGATETEINAAVENGILPARDRRTNPEARHAYRLRRADLQKWADAGFPTEAGAA